MTRKLVCTCLEQTEFFFQIVFDLLMVEPYRCGTCGYEEPTVSVRQARPAEAEKNFLKVIY
jgi:predicted Zn-ribbon and HTH transcriptional regulator